MNIFRRAGWVVLLVGVLSGCASAPTNISAESAGRIKRVAAISVVGGTFVRQYVGLTVFGNEREEKAIGDWGLDAAYEEQLAAALEQTLGLTNVKAPYAVADFSHVNDLTGPYNAPAFWGPNWEAIEVPTRAFCASNKLDAVVVVAKETSGDFLARTNQSFGGVGIFVRGPGQIVSVLHVLAKVGLLDCVSGKPLAIKRLTLSKAPPSNWSRLPLMDLPAEIARVPIPRWSDEQQRTIRNDLVSLPADGWSNTLGAIFQRR